jgi:hypothetical protein
MNYQIEKSFLDNAEFATLIWAENMLANFVASKDDKLGLNKCSPEEKRMMKVICKPFQIDFVEDQVRTFLQKTPDARLPYLTIKDILTSKKIEKHFSEFKTKFWDNSKTFPMKYVPYKIEAGEKEDFPRLSQKPTNKEVSQYDMSMYSKHSRGSSIDSESNQNISPHGISSSLA